MKFNKKDRKAQVMSMPFVMIFSIILIAITIYVGFIAIRGFLENADRIKVAAFVNDFKSDVNTLWQATSASRSYSYDLPSKIEKACFVNFASPLTNTSLKPLFDEFKRLSRSQQNNLFLAPSSFITGLQLPAAYKIDCGETTKVECLDLGNLPNPYCIQAEKGTVKIELLKEGKTVKIVKK